MKSAAKWFVAGGVLFLIIGFLLPVISVSNAGKTDFISPLQIAGVGYWFLLFPVPIIALVILLFALVPVNDERTRKLFIAGEAGGSAAILILLFGSLVYAFLQQQKLILWDPTNLGSLLSPEVLNGKVYTVFPGIGFFIMVLGIGIMVFGIILGFTMKSAKKTKSAVVKKDEELVTPQPIEKAKSLSNEAYLIRRKGDPAGEKIPIRVDDFSIGRSRENSLQIKDKTRNVSRIHARIRYSKDIWYVQDQKSKLGTFVNKNRVNATRLKKGDVIRIGEEVFEFHAGEADSKN